MNLTLDIETVPAQRPDVLEEIRESCKAELDSALEAICHPANYKDPAKIAEWNATVRIEKAEALKAAHEANVDAAYRKTGLDGAYGQICVIGYAYNDETPTCVWSMDEDTVLRGFFADLKEGIHHTDLHSTCVIGHGVVNFDLRFIAQRSIVNGIRPHMVIARAAQAKPWEQDKVFDTMVQWAGAGGKVSLDKLCKALSIPTPKGDLDGSKVWDWVKAGKLEEVANYCMRDVQATRAVWRRMTFQTVEQFDDVPA